MLFNSLTFIVFFCGVVLLHQLPLSWGTKKFNLVVASYLFYAAWNPPFVLLLVLSTLVDWFAAKGIARSRTRAGRQLFLMLSLVVNLGLLGYFKYAGFMLENFARLVAAWGVTYQPPALDIVLPVGISFYTFQTLSYTLDVYRGRFAPWHSFVDFALYVSFFPQLVAGPIVRASEFLPQCNQPRRATSAEFSWGLNLLVVGLFQKIVLADGLFRPVVDAVYHPSLQPDFASAWGGAALFFGQIYCDFAGYSTCAIGTAMCLGFALPDNFRWPVASIGFIDFWRRWHISLSTWLRDYVFATLRGAHRGGLRSSGALLLTMLLAGLWHGASWTFVAFGCLHGIGLVAENRWRRTRLARLSLWKSTGAQFLLATATFVVVSWTGVFFRAPSIEQAINHSATMFGRVHSSAASSIPDHQLLPAIMVLEILFVTHFLLRGTTLEQVADRLPSWLWGTLLAGMLIGIWLMPGDERAFIYFQF